MFSIAMLLEWLSANQKQKGDRTLLLSSFLSILSHTAIATFNILISCRMCALYCAAHGFVSALDRCLHGWSCAVVTLRAAFRVVDVGGRREIGDCIKHLTSTLDTLRGAMAAVRKRQSMTVSATSTAAAGGTSTVPRSTSQPGNCRGRVLSSSR